MTSRARASRSVTGLVSTLSLALALGSCTKAPADSHGHEHEPWAVTSYGERYEIFAEADPLTVGEVSRSHTHVTVLKGFQALLEGEVSAILRDSSGVVATFTQPKALRAGIFSIEIEPSVPGEFDLVFVVKSAAGTEEIPSGRVKVGPPGYPGGLVSPPATHREVTSGEPVSFLKEQQWRIPFATEWAHTGSLHASVSGPARVRPAAGGEAVLTAPLDGVVASSSTLYVGLGVQRDATVLELRPRSASGRSLAQIESESRLADERLKRLEGLYEAEAVSRAELDRARAQSATLGAELDGLKGTGRTIPVRAPFSGRLAEVLVTPGEAVVAGASLARLVRTDPLWLETGLAPESANELRSAPVGLVVTGAPGQPELRLGARSVRLVSRAPEVDRATGRVIVILQVSGAPELRVGTTVEAQILLPGERSGVVVPAEAIVDDAGVPIVYVQAEGESFTRREVRITAREGDRVLVEGVGKGDRVVTKGAAAIRRAAQMSSGEVEGHVH